jgi:hypothetical protein
MLRGDPTPEQAISRVRTLTPDQLGLDRSLCTGVYCGMSWVEYVFGRSSLRLNATETEIEWSVLTDPSRGPGSAPTALSLRFSHTIKPHAWNRDSHATKLIGRGLQYMTLSSPGIVYLDFDGESGHRCIMHTLMRLYGIPEPVLFWDPMVD